MSKRVSLSEEDFKTLISGGVVKQNGVELILQDIGYARMVRHIKERMDSCHSVSYFYDDPNMWSMLDRFD